MRQPRIELGAQRWQRWILPLNHWHYCIGYPDRSTPGIEPGTSSTLKTNHTPRPSGHMKIIRRGTHHNMLTQPHTVLTQHMYLQSGQADSVNNGVESVQHAHFSIVLRFPQPW